MAVCPDVRRHAILSIRSRRPLLALHALFTLRAGRTGIAFLALGALCTGFSLGAFQRTHVYPCRRVRVPLVHRVALRRTHEPRIPGASGGMGRLQR